MVVQHEKRNIKISELFVTHLRVRVSAKRLWEASQLVFSLAPKVWCLNSDLQSLASSAADTLCTQFATF